MNKFNNYKNVSIKMKFERIYHKLLNTKVKRIVTHSVIAFCGGISLAWVTLYIAGNVNVEKGVGGLETAGVPEFKISEDKVMESVAKAVEPAATEAALDADDSAMLDALVEGEEGGENLDEATAKVLGQDAYSSEGLELCYHTYRVKKGDMIGYIADNFGITQDTIISVNNIHQSRLLQIGQYLKIPSMPGIIYTVKKNGETPETIAEKYEVSAEKCARVNNIEKSTSLVAGTTMFVPDAQLDWVTKQEINGDLFHKPIHTRYYLSSYYGWRSSPFSGKRSYHSGMDMACAQGTPIYAALGGTVTSVGYNNVYGNYVIVTHHSGYKTLYGHMSKQLCTRGQWVDQNTRIGLVGSTGLSTGPHLHFTVYKFGKTVNPAALWR